VAILLIGAGQTILAQHNKPTQERGSIYLLRLLAFLLILVAIYRKNREADSR
jgi:hypothetical protein